MEMDEFQRQLRHAMFECQGSSAYSLERDRPYNGQAHTFDGERGKTLVSGLTIRDIADCITIGMLRASGHVRDYPIRDDLYKAALDGMDPVAAIQCTICEIERMMGIFPNTPKIERGDQE